MSAPAGAWRFHNRAEVFFGAGQRSRLGDLLAGRRVLVVTTGRGRAQLEDDALLSGALAGANVEFDTSVMPNPGLATLQASIDAFAGKRFDCILGFGGGSAIDAAKAIAAATHESAASSSLEELIVQPGEVNCDRVTPILALPTTSGTGSEVTPFATVWDHENQKKLSLASPAVCPQVAIVDPELTLQLPRSATISTGLDALNQALESVWNRNSSPITLGIAVQAIRYGLTAMEAYARGDNSITMRSDLAQASLLAGYCISQTRTAICHAISYPLTAHFDVPHGLACAFTMHEIAKLYASASGNNLAVVAKGVGQCDEWALVKRLGDLLADLEVVPVVSSMIGSLEKALELRGQMYTPGRADNFPIALDHELLGQILTQSFKAPARH